MHLYTLKVYVRRYRFLSRGRGGEYGGGERARDVIHGFVIVYDRAAVNRFVDSRLLVQPAIL